MPPTVTPERMAALDAAYHFTGTPNGELAQRWYPLAVRSGYHAADTAMAAFMQRVGRRKLIMPIYEALVKTPEGLQFAQDVFAARAPATTRSRPHRSKRPSPRPAKRTQPSP